MYVTDDTGMVYRDASKVLTFDVYEKFNDGTDLFYEVHLDSAQFDFDITASLDFVYAVESEARLAVFTDRAPIALSEIDRDGDGVWALFCEYIEGSGVFCECDDDADADADGTPGATA